MTAQHGLNLRQELGNIDIYLIDQILKGRFDAHQTILDAGCGSGRNLQYFLKNGFTVFAVDTELDALENVRYMAADLAPHLPLSNFCLSTIEKMPFEDQKFDAVICSAVLHFATDEKHFDAMMQSIWRTLKVGGLFFARLASTIGIENRLQNSGIGRHLLPDGSTRFLVDEATLLRYNAELGAIPLDPLKTTNVQNMRCMTTWCLQKSA